MTSPASAAADQPVNPDALPEEVPPAYSRLGFRDLQRLCKARGIPGDGRAPALIEKLEAWDLQHGRSVDITLPDEEEEDLLGDDMPAPATTSATLATTPATPAVEPAPQTPAGGGEVASASPPAGPALSGRAVRRGEADQPNVRTGPVERDGKVKAYRVEFPMGVGDVSDQQHATFIADAHNVAASAGYPTKGGSTIGARIGFGTDADGRRTVIYEVPVRRQQ